MRPVEPFKPIDSVMCGIQKGTILLMLADSVSINGLFTYKSPCTSHNINPDTDSGRADLTIAIRTVFKSIRPQLAPLG